MIDAWLNELAATIGGNMWLAPVLALLAGVLTSVTPCSLSSVPLIVGYVGGIGEKNTKKAFSYSAVFSIGMAITFVILGVIATSAGKLMGTSSPIWYIVLGALMVLMALQTWGIINIIPSTNLIAKSKKRGYVGAFLAGILGGVFSSPCSTPVLIVLLGILYSVGHSALVMVAGTSVGFVQKINSNESYKRAALVLKIVMGIAILLIGLYMFWLAF